MGVVVGVPVGVGVTQEPVGVGVGDSGPPTEPLGSAVGLVETGGTVGVLLTQTGVVGVTGGLVGVW